MPRPLRPRGSLTYNKPPLSLDDLVGRLADRGLDIPDPDRARRYLRHIGYYRLSPYTIPFQRGHPDHLLRVGTAFDDVLDLYVFDRALRLLVMDALERVEVAVRAALTDHMSTTYADPHWYMNVAHFRDSRRHAGFLEIVERLCDERLRGTADAGEDSLVHRSARALPDDLRLTRLSALLADSRDLDHWAVDERVPQPGFARRQEYRRHEHRPDRSAA
jgi:hypothetical protein